MPYTSARRKNKMQPQMNTEERECRGDAPVLARDMCRGDAPVPARKYMLT